MQKMSESPAVVEGGSPGGLESPSLFDPRAAGADSPAAYELKFLLAEEQAREMATRLRGRLALDPHADPSLGGAYGTTSLYTDTPQFDVFRRIGDYATCKYRVRRYGAGGPVFVERKEKDGQRVRKCRATVPADELALLASPGHRPDWVGDWFRSEAAERELRPVCRVSYERLAFMGSFDAGTVRVTLDRNIRGEAASGWEVLPVADGPELLPGFVVCEFKFRVALPAMLKELVAAFGLTPTTVSKYRRFARATDLAGTPEASLSGVTPAEGERVDG